MITLIVLVVLFFGIRIKIGISYKAKLIDINIIVFRQIYLVDIRVFAIHGKAYYIINKGVPRSLILKKRYAKLDLNMFRIRLYDGNMVVRMSLDDMAKLSMLGGILNMLYAYLEHGKRLDFDRFNGVSILDNDKFNLAIQIEFTIKFALIKIIFCILRTIIVDKWKRRQYAIKSN